MSKSFTIADLPHTQKNYDSQFAEIRTNQFKVQKESQQFKQTEQYHKIIKPRKMESIQQTISASEFDDQIISELKASSNIFISHLSDLQTKIHILQKFQKSQDLDFYDLKINEFRSQAINILNPTLKVQKPQNSLKRNSNSIFFKDILQSFETSRPKAIVFPSEICNNNNIYKTAVSSPFLQLGSQSFETPELYKKILFYVQRHKFNQFELNSIWCILTYYIKVHPEDILQGNIIENPLIKTFYYFKKDQNPTFCLVECDFLNRKRNVVSQKIGSIGIPYDNDKPVLNRIVQVDKLRQSDRRVQMDDQNIIDGFINILSLVIDYFKIRLV